MYQLHPILKSFAVNIFLKSLKTSWRIGVPADDVVDAHGDAIHNFIRKSLSVETLLRK